MLALAMISRVVDSREKQARINWCRFMLKVKFDKGYSKDNIVVGDGFKNYNYKSEPKILKMRIIIIRF